MLTGAMIYKEIMKENISITPFNKSRIGPNSYDVVLEDELKVYTSDVLDFKQDNEKTHIIIPKEGYVLQPGILYLGSTVESTHSDKYITCITGRSSVARLGINIHITAGMGNIGFNGKWTLEIFVLHPVRIYPGIKIGQVYFDKPIGKIKNLYRGKYQYQDRIITSRSCDE